MRSSRPLSDPYCLPVVFHSLCVSFSPSLSIFRHTPLFSMPGFLYIAVFIYIYIGLMYIYIGLINRFCVTAYSYIYIYCLMFDCKFRSMSNLILFVFTRHYRYIVRSRLHPIHNVPSAVRTDKLDSSFSRSRSSSMSSLENVSSESVTCLAFADSYTKKSGIYIYINIKHEPRASVRLNTELCIFFVLLANPYQIQHRCCPRYGSELASDRCWLFQLSSQSRTSEKRNRLWFLFLVRVAPYLGICAMFSIQD